MAAAPSHCPISNKTFAGDVFPDTETLIVYSPSAIWGTVKLTWNCPGATSPAYDTLATVLPIMILTPFTGTGEPITLPEEQVPTRRNRVELRRPAWLCGFPE